MLRKVNRTILVKQASRCFCDERNDGDCYRFEYSREKGG